VVHNRHGERLQRLPWWEALGVASSTGLELRLHTGVLKDKEGEATPEATGDLGCSQPQLHFHWVPACVSVFFSTGIQLWVSGALPLEPHCSALPFEFSFRDEVTHFPGRPLPREELGHWGSGHAPHPHLMKTCCWHWLLSSLLLRVPLMNLPRSRTASSLHSAPSRRHGRGRRDTTTAEAEAARGPQATVWLFCWKCTFWKPAPLALGLQQPPGDYKEPVAS
jgi:hypothetical protein